MTSHRPLLNGWQRVLLIVIPYVVLVMIFQGIGAMFAGADAGQIEASGTSIQRLIMESFDGLGTIMVLWLFMKFVDRKRFIELGFHFDGERAKEFAIGFGIGVLIISLGYILLVMLESVKFVQLDVNATELLILIGIYAIVAIIEEALFRGYMLRNLMNSLNRFIALFISAAFFAVLHVSNPDASMLSTLIIFLAGIMLGLSYVFTRNLWFPIGLHFGWNLCQSLFGFNVSGQDAYSLVILENVGDTALNGGGFGFEGTLPSLILTALTILFIWVYFSPKDASGDNQVSNDGRNNAP